MRVTQIVNGQQSTCAIDESREGWCWGRGEFGQLGNGTTGDRTRPDRINRITNLTAIAAGATHACAIESDGDLFCWGENEVGQLGTGSAGMFQTNPQRVLALSGVTMIAGGGISDPMVPLDLAHTCAVRSDGSFSCWGINDDGQLGDGTTMSRGAPGAVTGLTAPMKIVLGAAHTCALAAGVVTCWGRNEDGQLGDGTTAPHTTPAPIVLP